MALLEREITIIGPESNGRFGRQPQPWSTQYGDGGYYIDPLEKVDRAGAERKDYYKRVEATSQNLGILGHQREKPISTRGQTLLDLADDGDVVVRQKSISDGGPSIDSVPRVPEPHTSWRFYTSYDDGEWRRHMVPVFHSEEEVLTTSPSRTIRTRTESSSGDIHSFLSDALSPTFGLETSIRRMRVNRPSVYEALQSRRRRTFDDSRRIRTPRSPESILSISDYLPQEELKRRYEVKDYQPKRRTEYGERVIYPRVKSGSISGFESESKIFSGTRRESVFEEVTRNMHPNDISTSAFPLQTVEVVPANSKPSNDFEFQEKVIIPTKYKTGIDKEPLSRPKANAGNQKDISYGDQQHIKSRSQHGYHLDRPMSDERRIAYAQEEITKSSMNRDRAMPRIEFDGGLDNISRSLDDYEYESRTSRRDERGYENVAPARMVDGRPRDKSRSQEREVKVVVVKSQQRDKSETPERDEKFQVHQTDRWEKERPIEWGSRVSSEADELAARVRSGTMDTMRQMESQMVDHMKKKCPEAADIMDSLVSGAELKDMTVERKEAFTEQVGLWKGGKPLEEKLNRETRYRTNDPISGPQDLVERSSITREGEEMLDQRMHVDPNATSRMYERASHRLQDSPEKPAFTGFGRNPSSMSSSNDGVQTRGYFPDKVKERSEEMSTRRSFDVEKGGRSADASFRTQERASEVEEKIIIPTKYRQKVDANAPPGPERTTVTSDSMHSKSPSEESHGLTRKTTVNPIPAAKDGGLSSYASFVASRLDSSNLDESDAYTSASARSAAPRAAEVRGLRTAPPQTRRPVEMRRLGSLHGEADDGWEFDMAVREIPRN